MIISRKRSPTLPSSPIVVDSSPLDKVDSYKYLGVWITSSLSWSLQIDEICMKAIGGKLVSFTDHSTVMLVAILS